MCGRKGAPSKVTTHTHHLQVPLEFIGEISGGDHQLVQRTFGIEVLCYAWPGWAMQSPTCILYLAKIFIL
mgnify:CR=1 FL=1